MIKLFKDYIEYLKQNWKWYLLFGGVLFGFVVLMLVLSDSSVLYNFFSPNYR